MTTDTFPLPSTYAYGKVVGRIIYAIGDTAEDADDKPQARAAAGTVTFTPMATGAKVTTADYTAIIMNGAVKANLSSSGRILDAEGRQGIWLIQGIYRVDFSFTATSDGLRGSLPPFQIEVLPAHTDLAPLDLASAAPASVPEGAVVQTIVLPTGSGIMSRNAVSGEIEYLDPDDLAPTVSQINSHLGGDAAGLVGRVTTLETSKADLGGDGKVLSSQLPAGIGMADATVSAKGAVRLSGDLAGTADSPTVPGLAGKADDTSVLHRTGAETVAGVKTFTSAPVVPDGSFGPSKIAASGTPDSAKYLRGDGQWATAPGTVTYGTTAGTAAQGNDGRIVGAAQKASNLADLADATTARANLAVLSSVQTGTTVVLMGDVARNHPVTGAVLPTTVQVIWVSATEPAAMDDDHDIWLTF